MNFVDVIIPNLKYLSSNELLLVKTELDKVLDIPINLEVLKVNARNVYVAQKSGLRCIKYIKDTTGWSLVECKAWFEVNIKNVEIPQPTFNAEALLRTTKYLIETNHKYNAVAHVKDYTGWSLDDCKIYCDDIAKSI